MHMRSARWLTWVIVGFAIGAGTAARTVRPATAADDAVDPRRARRTPVVEVFEQCRDAVVNIATTRIIETRSMGGGWMWDDLFHDVLPPRQRIQSVGSGAVIHERGYIVTNAHVVSRASDIQVTFANGETLAAQRIAVDPEHDLAILKVDAARPLPFVRIARPGDIMIGETVVAIGNPLGLQHTATAGIVSAMGREIALNRDVVYRDLIQTDTPINPGNSGGPLLNVNAELIGINTAIRGDAQNIGFSIPTQQLWELIPRMLDVERHERVRFGLAIAGAEPRVQSVAPDSPAGAAGVRDGDRIVQMQGQPVRDAIDYYVALREQPVDRDVKLKIERGGRTLDVAAKLQSIPPPDGAALAQRLFGITLAEQRPSARSGLPDDLRLVVSAVAPGSPADQVGIRNGDYVVRLSGIAVGDLTQLGLLLENVPAGSRVLIEGARIEGDWLYIWREKLRARGS